MKIQASSIVLTTALLCLWPLYATGDTGPGGDEVPFELVDGYLIIVKGSLPRLDRDVNVLIDTGATATFVSRKLASDGGLQNLPSNGINASAFGSSVEVERVLLSDLRLGPRSITRSCLAADLRWEGIDVVLGLDVLRSTSLTIDYENSKLVFGAAQGSMEQMAVLEEEEGLLIVRVTMNGKTRRLAVDTGAHLTLVYQQASPVGDKRAMDEKLVKIAHSGGSTVARQFTLSNLHVGETRIGPTSLAVLAIQNERSNIDGFLGIASLGLKRIHLDFELQALLIES